MLKVFLLLGLQLSAAEFAPAIEVDDYPTQAADVRRLQTPDRLLSLPPPPAPPPPGKLRVCDLQCKLGWGLGWSALCATVAACLLFYLLTAQKREKEPFDPTILRLYCFSLGVMEPISYTVQTLSLILYDEGRFSDYDLALDFVSVFQILNGILIWTVAVLMMRFDRHNDVKRILTVTGTVGASLALIYIVLAFVLPSVKVLVFLVWFEPVFWIRLGSALVIAGSVPKAHHWALTFCGIKFIIVLMHMYGIMIELDSEYERDWSFPVTRLMHILLEPIAAFALVQMARNGAFIPGRRRHVRHFRMNIAEAATVLIREKELVQISEASRFAWRTHFVSPEKLWMYGSIGQVCGYIAAGALLFGVTKPDFSRDPIYNMYATFHTCMLLDYLPGSFAAYVFFGIMVLGQQACALATFVRTALSGSMLLTLASMFVTTYFYFICAQFPLVFVLSPSATTVLAHSVPYMLHQSALAGFFLISIWSAVVLAKVSRMITWRMRLHYLVYAVIYLLILIYGLSFMFTILLENAGMGDNSGKPRRSTGIAMEAYADRDGSTSLMGSMHSCDGTDFAVLDKMHPWGYVPSELVGTVRGYSIDRDISATRSFVRADSFTIDGYGVSNLTATVFQAGGASAMAAAAATVLKFTPAAKCDALGTHVFTQQIFSMCRARNLEDENWFALHAMVTEQFETECVGAGAASVASDSTPPKFASGVSKGSCRQLMLSKDGGTYSKQLRESTAATGAMVSDNGVMHLRWSICPNISAAEFVAERQWTYEDGTIKIVLEMVPALATLMIVFFLIAYPFIQPLRKVPLAMEVMSYENNQKTKPTLVMPTLKHYRGTPHGVHKGAVRLTAHGAQLPSGTNTYSTFYTVIRARAFFRLGMILLLIAAAMSNFLNNAVWGKDAIDKMNLRDVLKTQPGASVVATIYTIFAGLTLVYVMMEVYHQHWHNASVRMRAVGYLMLFLMAFGLLIGPTSLVPGADEYWTAFYGVNILQLFLLFWLAYQTGLLWQRGVDQQPVEQGEAACHWKTAETVIALVTIVLLFISIISSEGGLIDMNTSRLDAGFLVGLVAWSFVDERQLTFHFVNIRIADEADKNLYQRRQTHNNLNICNFLRSVFVGGPPTPYAPAVEQMTEKHSSTN